MAALARGERTSAKANKRKTLLELGTFANMRCVWVCRSGTARKKKYYQCLLSCVVSEHLGRTGGERETKKK